MDALDEAIKMNSEQGSDNWIDVRLGRFTASEIHKLMTEPRNKADKEAGNLSETAKTYVLKKVSEVMTGRQADQSYAYPLVYGKEMEPNAINEFIKRTGFKYEPATFVPFGDHAGGSPDGYINETDGLEIKCPFTSDKQVEYLMLKTQNDLLKEFPEYYWQCMSNLLFSGKEKWWFVTYDPRMIEESHRLTKMIILPIESDFDKIINRIEKAVEEKLLLLNKLK